MGSRYRKYPREFKIEALQLLAKGGKSAAELERELGISKGMLLKWRDRYKVGGQGERLEPGDLEAANTEIRRQKRDLEVTSQERDILKKSHRHLLEQGGMIYEFIAGHTEEFPVMRMCEVLEVSTSGYPGLRPGQAMPGASGRSAPASKPIRSLWSRYVRCMPRARGHMAARACMPDCSNAGWPVAVTGWRG
jgi:transposase-like protein